MNANRNAMNNLLKTILQMFLVMQVPPTTNTNKLRSEESGMNNGQLSMQRTRLVVSATLLRQVI